MDLKKILDEHLLWLNGEGGSCANLFGANLRGANLSDADLRCADLRNADLCGIYRSNDVEYLYGVLSVAMSGIRLLYRL